MLAVASSTLSSQGRHWGKMSESSEREKRPQWKVNIASMVNLGSHAYRGLPSTTLCFEKQASPLSRMKHAVAQPSALDFFFRQSDYLIDGVLLALVMVRVIRHSSSLWFYAVTKSASIFKSLYHLSPFFSTPQWLPSSKSYLFLVWGQFKITVCCKHQEKH